jgi:acyl phosphate:glycerol-3-phosphate acyltransferase
MQNAVPLHPFMAIFIIVLLGIAAYLLGSIPSAVWIGKSYYGTDVRDHGSHNAGATNTFRVLGTNAGSIVLVLDALKGATAANLAMFVASSRFDGNVFVGLQILFGILAVIGHIFPVFANFRGGKGIATLLGMVLAINWQLALVCLALFVLILLLTRYVSLSSMISTISFPIFAVYLFHEDQPLLIAFGITMALLVVLTHKKNIYKLLHGEENKAKILRKHRVQNKN